MMILDQGDGEIGDNEKTINGKICSIFNLKPHSIRYSRSPRQAVFLTNS